MADQELKTCEHCGAEFSGKQATARFCSKVCKRRAGEKRLRGIRVRKRNPAYLERRRQRTLQRQKERQAAARAANVCRVCSHSLADRPGQTKYCSSLCHKIDHAPPPRPPRPPKPELTEEEKRQRQERRQERHKAAYHANREQRRRHSFEWYHQQKANPEFRKHINFWRRIRLGEPTRRAKELARKRAQKDEQKFEREIARAVRDLGWMDEVKDYAERVKHDRIIVRTLRELGWLEEIEEGTR